MKEINLVDLTNWFENKTRKKIEPLKKEAEKKISKCESIFDELRVACKLLEEQPSSITDELIVKSAKRFSEKLVIKLDEIKFPEEITYENIENFKIKLENLLNTISNYGKRWVSKLGRDKSYLQNIRDINYLLKDIQNLYLKLVSFLDNKYRKGKKIESIGSLIDRLIELKEEAKSIKTANLEIENQLNENEKELNQTNEKIQILEKDEIINKLNLIDKKFEKINGTIRNLIGPIRKSLKKISKLIENEEFTARPDSVSFITAYLNEPIKSYLSDADCSHLKSILLDLRDAINSNKLKLKSSAQKKIMIKIKEVDNKDLNLFKSQLEQLNTVKQALLSNPEYKKKLQNLKELKQEKELVKRKNEDIHIKLNKIIEDYNRMLNKLGDLKAKAEKSIFEITNIPIKLLL